MPGRLDADQVQKIERNAALASSIANSIWRQAPQVTDLDDLRSAAYMGLVAAAERWPAYCLVPETPVLRADLRWVSVGSLEPGVELVGVDEYPEAPRVSRSYRRSVVTSVQRRLAECVRLTLEDGRQVTSAVDHRWLLRKQRRTEPGKLTWWRADTVAPGDLVVAPLRYWSVESTFESGWLSGIFDGEGWICRRGTHTTIGFAQKEGAVLDRAKGLLSAMGIPFNVQPDSYTGVTHIYVTQRKYAIELAGRLQPVRLRTDLLWADMRLRAKAPNENYYRVDMVERLGVTNVVSVGTTSRTFLANGIVSHNCDENGFDPGEESYFTVFAGRRIRGSVVDSMRAGDWARRSLRDKAKAIQSVEQPGDSIADLARKSGMTVTEVRHTHHGLTQRPLSLDAGNTMDPPVQQTVESAAGDQEVRDAVCAVLNDMPIPHRTIVALHYYAGLELQEVARLLDITESRASHLHTETVLAVRDRLLKLIRARL